MIHESRQPESRNFFVIRYGILGGVLLAIGLVAFGILSYPSAFTLAPVETIVYLVLFTGLVSGFSWLALHRTKANESEEELALLWGGRLGFVLGICWLIELWTGNAADPSTSITVMIAYRASILVIPVLIVITACLASRRTTRWRSGIWVGLWSGIISALIAFTGLMAIAYSGLLLHDPQTIQQSLKNGIPDIMAYGVADSLVAAINHLWIGPVLGIILGALGGLIGGF